MDNINVRGYDIMEYLTRGAEPGKESEFAMVEDSTRRAVINGRATINGIPNDGFKVGDWVRNTWHGEAGEIISLTTIAEVKTDERDFACPIDELEATEKPRPKLTPEQAWLELPMLIAELINDKAWISQLSKDKHRDLYETDRTEIRHQAYILLGGADPRIDITEPVKERVRNVIERMAAVLGVRYLKQACGNG